MKQSSLLYNSISTMWLWSLLFTGRNEVVAKVMFLHMCVILFTGGQSLGWENPPGRENPFPLAGRTLPAGRTPLGRENPPPQSRPPRADTPPGSRPPWDQTPPEQTHPSPLEADCSIRSMSDRYASYWNAFLFGMLSINENN